MSEASKQFIESLWNQPVAIMVLLKSGTFIIAGLDGWLELDDVGEEVGTKQGDANGYTLKLTGVSQYLTSTIDPTYAMSIVTVNPNQSFT